MTKKFFYSVAVLALINSCAKDSGTPDPDFLKDVQKELMAYDWQPIISETDNIRNYKPDECEMDNSYRFLFQEKSNQVDLDKGEKICEANKGSFEQWNFKGKNNSTFTFNKGKNILKFSHDDEYSSYLVVIKGDKLVLEYQNNNPLANVIPMKYYFKGVKM